MVQHDTDGADPEQDAAAVDPSPLITSRFLFVDVAAQRAKQLRRGALLRIERHPSGPHKLERLAMEEVRQQLVHYTVPTGYLGKGETKETK
ncbi:MAG TPA: DNA-directed RNA polymerase subunit omega [Vicinamibacterales bacterium]|jgi:DNA-directed RNA polymerase subunit K/omega|nr:DNA-directed RNA polymerase subunit omega [Vicinamibacterales bacterium]